MARRPQAPAGRHATEGSERWSEKSRGFGAYVPISHATAIRVDRFTRTLDFRTTSPDAGVLRGFHVSVINLR